MLIPEKLPYLLGDQEFYEPIAKYPVQLKDFYEPASRVLPDGWKMERRNLWFDVSCPESQFPAQGWKIHLSATLGNAPAVLVTALRILTEAKVPFKFIADKSLLLLTNGKRWQRGGAGKFLTAYPKDTEQSGELLEKLYRAMIGYTGPYILSDRRYKDSRVVYYRYGGFNPTKRMDVDGKPVYIIQGADGDYIDDDRNPYFQLPNGIEDPFATESDGSEEGEAGTLCNGRYEIEKVLSFTNPGGVYLARDRETDQQVVIKEARPFANFSVRGLDAVWLLKKEHRLLEVLADTGFTPRPYDFFFDWEHAYLVEEFIEKGFDLRGYLTGLSLALRTRSDLEYSEEFFTKYRRIFRQLAEMVKVVHDRKIVFSDLSYNNVLMLEEDEELCLIDFEGAFEVGVDVPTNLFTPGFTPMDSVEEGKAHFEDDYYALGGLMMAGLFPMNALFVLDRSSHFRYLKAFQRDFGLPEAIADIIARLLEGDRSKRPGPTEIIEVLAEDFEVRPPTVGTSELDDVDLLDLAEKTLSYIDSVADFEREERLFPADPMVFETNPLSLAHGACGVAYVMHRIRGEVDSRVLDWIRDREVKPHAYTPGLFLGLSGMAWTFLEMGLEDEAKAILADTEDHYLLWRSHDLFNGATGWGMTQLHFFIHTGDERYLDQAKQAGEFLLETAQEDEEKEGRRFWATGDDISYGVAHGSAGVSLFLLYLHLATGDQRYMDVGRQGLEFVLDHGVRNPDDGLTWPASKGQQTFTPYWRYGSSGIGRVVLRYWQLTGEQRLENAINHLHIDCDRKYAIFPGYFFGLAGIAEFYLDLAEVPGYREMALAGARKVMAGTMLFPMERPGGLAYPGESLSRISCDFGTGGAGVALMAHRLATHARPSFMLDELMPKTTGVETKAEADVPVLV